MKASLFRIAAIVTYGSASLIGATYAEIDAPSSSTVEKSTLFSNVSSMFNNEDNLIITYDESERLQAKEIFDSQAKTLHTIYTLRDLQFHGVIRWNGYKFTYYSQSVLPGGGLRIPGRHVSSAGYVSDGDGYIVLAGSKNTPKGTVIDTPFGMQGKVYDTCPECSSNWFDVYTK